MTNTKTPAITITSHPVELDGTTVYVADGPGATSQSLLARGTAAAAERDGLAYFTATRRWNGRDWVIFA